MSDQTRAGAVIYAKDLPGVSAFYSGAIGLDVAQRADDHVLLSAPGFDLTVVAIPAHIAGTIEIEVPPSRREETPIKLIFPVTSVRTVRAAAARYGGEIDPPEREWVYRGTLVCDGHDPEGNVIQLREWSS
jgi:predicted enzyme related to lactoylglutathione lyase